MVKFKKPLSGKELEDYKKDLNLLRDISMSCYWSTEYYSDYKGTVDHFNGEDYSLYYTQDCQSKAYANWEKLKDQ